MDCCKIKQEDQAARFGIFLVQYGHVLSVLRSQSLAHQDLAACYEVLLGFVKEFLPSMYMVHTFLHTERVPVDRHGSSAVASGMRWGLVKDLNLIPDHVDPTVGGKCGERRSAQRE